MDFDLYNRPIIQSLLAIR
jgi:hypothetical protein